uniref:Uncharacterized protein n=1 Tax=Arundo donax TaxID=35708 RepID=A0A0A9EEL3_ARUDO
MLQVAPGSVQRPFLNLTLPQQPPAQLEFCHTRSVHSISHLEVVPEPDFVRHQRLQCRVCRHLHRR